MSDGMLMGVYREEIYSPGKVREDAAILDAALAALAKRGSPSACVLKAEDLRRAPCRPRWVLNMAQSGHALALLERWEREGTRIFNSVQSVKNCYRKPLIHLLESAGAPLPPSRIMRVEEVVENVLFYASGRYWLKRGDVHAVQTGDVVEVDSEVQLVKALDHFHGKGIDEVLVQEHVKGETIKFYGVGPGAYFDAFQASSGKRIVPPIRKLVEIANHASEATGLEVFGGDAVLTTAGEVFLIDLNDWPSFSRRRAAAAEGIAEYVARRCKGGFHESSGFGYGKC